MSNKIVFKRSAVAGKIPALGDLALGEIALNTYDGKAYIKQDNGTQSIIQLGGSSAADLGVTSDAFAAANSASLYANTGITLAQAAYNQANTIVSGTITATTPNTIIDSYSTLLYRSAKYDIQISDDTGYHVIEIRSLHDRSNSYISQYGEMYTGGSLGTFSSNNVSGNTNLYFTPTSSTSEVTFNRTLLSIGTYPDLILPTDLMNGSTTIDLLSGPSTIDLNQ